MSAGNPTHNAKPISSVTLPVEGFTELLELCHFLPLHSRGDKSSDLSTTKLSPDIASDLLEVPELLVSPDEVAHTSPTNEVTAWTQVLGITAEPSFLSLDEICKA